MLLVCLYILTEFYLAMSIEVQLAIVYYFRWALCFGHATLEGEHVAPEHGGIYHFYDHDGGQMIKWDYIVIALNLVLQDAVVSLDFWDVFVLRRDTKMDVQVGKADTHWLKLIINEHDNDFKTSGDVCIDQGFEVLEYVTIFHAI